MKYSKVLIFVLFSVVVPCKCSVPGSNVDFIVNTQRNSIAFEKSVRSSCASVPASPQFASADPLSKQGKLFPPRSSMSDSVSPSVTPVGATAKTVRVAFPSLPDDADDALEIQSQEQVASTKQAEPLWKRIFCCCGCA